MQRLLVYVLANRRDVSEEAEIAKQGRFSQGDQERAAARLAAIRQRRGRGLVPDHSARCAAPPREGWRLKRVDDVPVWSISCLYVRKGYRRRGIARALIDAAVRVAKQAGAPALQAYPVDRNLLPSSTSTGFATTYEKAGFKIVARHLPPRPIMRRDL
jgi:GNAT superfamily N-acetyltransferase